MKMEGKKIKKRDERRKVAWRTGDGERKLLVIGRSERRSVE
jgi:hypothetical protein